MINKLLLILSILLFLSLISKAIADDLKSLFPEDFLENSPTSSLTPTPKTSTIPAIIPNQPNNILPPLNPELPVIIEEPEHHNIHLNDSKEANGIQHIPKAQDKNSNVLNILPPLLPLPNQDNKPQDIAPNNNILLAPAPQNNPSSLSEIADELQIHNLPIIPSLGSLNDKPDEQASEMQAAKEHIMIPELKSKLKQLDQQNPTEIKINNLAIPKSNSKEVTDVSKDNQRELKNPLTNKSKPSNNKLAPNFEGLISSQDLAAPKQHIDNTQYSTRNSTKILTNTSEFYQVNPYDLWQSSVMFTPDEIEQLEKAFSNYLMEIVQSANSRPEEKSGLKEDKKDFKETKKPLILILNSVLYINKDLWSIWLNNKRYTSEENDRDLTGGIKILQVNPDSVIIKLNILANYLVPDDLYNANNHYNQVIFNRNRGIAEITLYINQAFSTETMNVVEGENRLK